MTWMTNGPSLPLPSAQQAVVHCCGICGTEDRNADTWGPSASALVVRASPVAPLVDRLLPVDGAPGTAGRGQTPSYTCAVQE